MRRAPKLTVEQIEIVAQFADFAFDYPILTFEEVARKVMRARPFPKTPNGREFKRQAKEVFDRERSSERSLARRAVRRPSNQPSLKPRPAAG